MPKRDWLQNAVYKGREQLNLIQYDKWSLPEGNIDYWASIDGRQIPRKIAKNGEEYMDFLPTTYAENPIADLVFLIPNYCKNVLCPSSSKCGQYRK
jgi:hypothetical protein